MTLDDTIKKLRKSPKVTKLRADRAIRKLAAVVAEPMLPPEHIRNAIDRLPVLTPHAERFLKKEDQRLQTPRAKKVTIKPKGDQPLVLQVHALVIKSNKKHGRNDPPLRVRQGRNGDNPVHAHTLELTGPSKIIHSPDKPLKCGARVWIETHHPVKAK